MPTCPDGPGTSRWKSRRHRGTRYNTGKETRPIELRIGKLRIARISFRLLWDLFMVWVAIANLTLILFDLTYLKMRPLYFRHLPLITEVYDPVKGIEPHPLTQELLDEVQATRHLLDLDPGTPRLGDRVQRLRELSVRMFEENPFARSGQTRNLQIIKVQMAAELGVATTVFDSPEATRRTVETFWPVDPVELEERLVCLGDELEDRLGVNYHREYDLGGHLTDRFWLLDLPFLALFWIEFCLRWAVAIRRRIYARWFFFPIFYWYDLLGLVPSAYFRPLRLLRIASIYMRLRRSKHSAVGDDFVSRTVAYISNIITEEITDMVSIRILDEYQEEIRDGTHIRILESTVGSRRGEIHEVVARQVREVLTNEAAVNHFRELLRLNLETAVSSGDALRNVPLPDAVLKPIIRAVGEVLLDTTLDTVTATLDSDEGQQITHELVATIVDELLGGPGVEELEAVFKEISLDILEHMKQAVAVKKWAQPKADLAERLTRGDGDEEGLLEAGEEDGGQTTGSG